MTTDKKYLTRPADLGRSGSTKTTRQKIKADKEQATRTAWRNVRDWVLAQVALMESCTVDAAQCFLPYMVDRSGTTLYEAYSSGRLMLGNGEET